MELGDVLRRLRKGKGLNQKQLAAKTKIPANTIHRFENDYKSTIPLDRLEILAKALDTSVPAIYAYKENPLLLDDPMEYYGSQARKPRVSVLVELDGSVENLNTWVATLKKLNAAM